MASSRSLAVCLLITRMFMSLLICLDNYNMDIVYDLLLSKVILLLSFYSTIYHLS